ncbi:hypothetical protein C8Q74DRAFT_1208215, partial [Fomes fomentarius]
ALCLLEMHEIAASHSWTGHFRYFELAVQVLEGSLKVQRHDNGAPPSPSESEGAMLFIERESTWRCFWLVQLIAWVSQIYTRREIRPRMVELADLVRLPIDETTFELASFRTSSANEYLRHAASRTRYASQFGHILCILELYHNVEAVLANQDGQAHTLAMNGFHKDLEDWVASLPNHLQFNDENLETQITMFETSSNSGAWCFSFMHAMYSCCSLSLLEGEGTLTEPVPWVRDQLSLIFTAAGTRARTSILSACAIWSYSKCSPDDPQIHVWDLAFAELWGFGVIPVAQQRREGQAKDKEQQRAQAQVQQQQQQMYQPRGAKSNFNSPTLSHSSPGTPPPLYEGGQGNPRALLRTYVSMSDESESVVSSQAVSLPSLKASGLLNLWRPPSEVFAHSLPVRASLPQA